MLSLYGTVSSVYSILTALKSSNPISVNTFAVVNFTLATSPIHFATDKPSNLLNFDSIDISLFSSKIPVMMWSQICLFLLFAKISVL